MCVPVLLVCYSGTAFVTDVRFSLHVYKEGNVGKGFLSVLAAAPWAGPMSLKEAGWLLLGTKSGQWGGPEGKMKQYSVPCSRHRDAPGMCRVRYTGGLQQ